jgi:hypothetical protein
VGEFRGRATKRFFGHLSSILTAERGTRTNHVPRESNLCHIIYILQSADIGTFRHFRCAPHVTCHAWAR